MASVAKTRRASSSTRPSAGRATAPRCPPASTRSCSASWTPRCCGWPANTPVPYAKKLETDFVPQQSDIEAAARKTPRLIGGRSAPFESADPSPGDESADSSSDFRSGCRLAHIRVCAFLSNSSSVPAASFGVVRVDEALELGLTEAAIRRRVAAGLLERIGTHCLRFPGHPETWRRAFRVGLLDLGDDALVAPSVGGVPAGPRRLP